MLVCGVPNVPHLLKAWLVNAVLRGAFHVTPSPAPLSLHFLCEEATCMAIVCAVL
jgi:hypothetical protein